MREVAGPAQVLSDFVRASARIVHRDPDLIFRRAHGIPLLLDHELGGRHVCLGREHVGARARPDLKSIARVCDVRLTHFEVALRYGHLRARAQPRVVSNLAFQAREEPSGCGVERGSLLRMRRSGIGVGEPQYVIGQRHAQRSLHERVIAKTGERQPLIHGRRDSGQARVASHERKPREVGHQRLVNPRLRREQRLVLRGGMVTGCARPPRDVVRGQPARHGRFE